MVGKTAEETLAWLRLHHPRNFSSINALESKLGLPLTPATPKPTQRLKCLLIAQENQRLRELRQFLPGHEPDR